MPYAGVVDTLAALHGSGKRLFVATNKRRRPAERILASNGLARYVEALYTLDSAEPPWVDKADMAAACVKRQALQPSTTIVVGDSREDEAMAAANGLSFAAAAWGYGDASSRIVEGRILLKSISDLILFVLPEFESGRGL